MKAKPVIHNPDSVQNVLGRTVYLDDLPEPSNLLHGAPVLSPSAHGRYERLDCSAALELDPSVRVLTAADIPGENQLGTIVMDEPMLAEGVWHFRGQVLALVLASSRSLARRAAGLVKVVGREDLPAVTDPRIAKARGDIILSPRTQRSGDVAKAFAEAELVVSGRVESAGQEHVYLETQGSIAWPDDAGGVRIVSGTQGPSGVQKIVARILGLPMNLVEIETRRMGGAFGGKEDQASGWAALAALGAYRTGRPVKIYLSRKEDMTATGKRHPYSSDFRIALRGDGTILGFEADYYQNSGAATDLSPAIIPRTLFHAAGAYHIPNVRVTGWMCRTNLVPFTAFRGFGGPQGFFVIEAALDKAALALGMDPVELRRRNLLSEGDTMHYGMPVERCLARETFDACLRRADLAVRRKAIDEYNRGQRTKRKGLAVMPVCFGISFTKMMMNQGGALVHVYNDGSVGVSTGATEMGQGVGRKIGLIVAAALGIEAALVRIESTRTTTVANTFPTAASTGTDINGMAAQIASREIRQRLLDFAASRHGCPATELELRSGKLLRIAAKAAGSDGTAPVGQELESFAQLVAAAHEQRVDLSAHGFFATPGLHFDLATEQGSPFAYHVYGCALLTATVDLLTGTYSFDEAVIVHDCGTSLDELIDRGQIEGAFAQGLGWAALEDLVFAQDGRLLSDTLSTYKLPDGHFMPEMDVEMYQVPNPKAVANSKAVGEPPLMYGIAGYFAVLDALRAAGGPARPDFVYSIPMTAEKAMLYLTARPQDPGAGA